MTRAPGKTVIPVADFDAVIFDLDGVVTKTARLHAAAWKRLFDDFLARRATPAGGPITPFDPQTDYLRYVDGKPRADGVVAFLASRGIRLPYGEPDDADDRDTVCGLGNRKNRYFRRALEEQGVDAFDTTLEFLRDARDRGLETAIVSSSRNCLDVLDAADLRPLFDAHVDGRDLLRHGLGGKPAPDMYIRAAELLGVRPGRAVIIEDARAGVEAGRAGAFGLVLGLDRAGQAAELLAAGADAVVQDLQDVHLEGRRRPGTRGLLTLPSALDVIPAILHRVGHRRPVFFLDYDGTLTPIVSRPELAVLTASTRRALEMLARHYTVAIVSGRDRMDVERLVGLKSLYYAGSHGFDIAGPSGLGIRHEPALEYLPHLDRAEQALESRLHVIEGALVERKKFSVAVHYRLVADEQQRTVEEAVDQVVADLPALRKHGGKKIFELQPAMDWNKGKAVLWLLDALELALATVHPLYLGDDLTDEDAFRTLERIGTGVVVGDADRPTAARYALAAPDEVRRFLEQMCAHDEETSA